MMSFMNIIKSKYILSFLLITLGVIFISPKVYADDTDVISENITIASNYINNRYSSANVNTDDYYYICSLNNYSSPAGFFIVFIPKNIDYNLSIQYYGTTTSFVSYISSDSAYCYKVAYVIGSEPRDNAYFQYQRSFQTNLDYDYTHTNDFIVFKSSELNVTNLSPDIITIVDYDINTFTPEFYHQSEVLLTQYNQTCGFNYSRTTAWFVNNQGRMTQIPISQVEPEGYTGLYCYPYEYSKFLTGFKVRLTTGENPLDYQLYWNQQLVVEFEDVNYTTLSLYGLQSNNKFAPDVVFYKNPSDRLPLDNSETTQGYFTVDCKNYIGTHIVVTEENNVTGKFYLVGNWWSDDLGVSDLLFGMSFTQTDDNGNVTNGKGSTNYNNTVNNYIQQSQIGLTGVYNGQNGLSSSFSKPDSLDITEPTYNGDYDLTYDGNFLYLFDKLMDLEFVTKMLIGVFSISIAIYIIFGSSY